MLVYVVPSTVSDRPPGAVFTVARTVATKFAVTLFGALIVTEVGLLDPDASPDQLEKRKPLLAVALTETTEPLSRKLDPLGDVVPPSEGLELTVSEYCVVKFAVKVASVVGATV